LWSLGVEEQFYLFWPWVVLFTPARFRAAVFIIVVGLSLGCHFVCYTDIRLGLLPFANFHTLGCGALLACFYTKNGNMLKWLNAHCNAMFYLALLHLVAVLVLFNPGSASWHLYREVSLCLCTFSIVLVSVVGWKGSIGCITRTRSLQYIGTISYGIYLFHMPIPNLYRVMFSKMHIAQNLPDSILIVLCVLTTVLCASLSYKYIETPFLRAKRFFAWCESAVRHTPDILSLE